MNGKVLVVSCFMLILFTSCHRSGEDVWDDTKTAGRHMTQGIRTLGGKHGDSRQIRDRDEFMRNDYCWDFVPLEDDDEAIAMVKSRIPQSKYGPGDPGSPIPGISAFKDPATVSGLSRIFQNVRFPYNSSQVKGEGMQTVGKIAAYMKAHQNLYIFVEGHCDERGPQAYNLALGTRRANAVRNLLVKEGVDPNRIFTISYGKEKPLVPEHHDEAWAMNRRAEFKIFER